MQFLHQLTAADWFRRTGWSLLFIPPIILLPLTLVLFVDPWAALKNWDLYFLWFGLPWLLGLVLLMQARRLKRRAGQG